MRRPTTTALAVMLASLAAAANGAGQEIPEFHWLRTPASPAFMILGISPAVVERPTAPGAFTASLLQRAAEAIDGLPSSWAVEIAPYWLKHHPDLTFDDYARGGPASIVRNFTFSLATTDSAGSAAGTDARRLGLGLRTTLVPGTVPDTARACVDRVSALAALASVAIGRAVVDAIAAGVDSAGRARIQAAVFEREKEALQEVAAECTELLSTREGFALDVAAGMAAAFPDGRAAAGRLESVGLWLTPGFLGRNFSHLAVARLLLDVAGEGTDRIVDLGVRSIYAWDRFAGSGEAVYRNVDPGGASDDLFRLSVVFDAKIADGSWLSIALGRDFDGASDDSLLASLGFKWQIGEDRITPPLDAR